jgi:hypothetical protein
MLYVTIFLGKQVPLSKIIIPVPSELFGDDNLIPPIEGVLLDPLAVIASKLLDNTVVGQNLEHFSFKAQTLKKRSGERILSNPSTGKT